jgi:hypothetical protein
MNVLQRFGCGVLLPFVITVPALAGPNAGGTIFCHDVSRVWTLDLSTYCGVGIGPESCPAADTEIDGATAPVVWKVYVAFAEGSSPRLKAMAWGIQYDAALRLVAWGQCADFPCPSLCEFYGPGWPGSDTGDAVVWGETQTTTLVEAYWFAGYNYGGSPATFRLRNHPDPHLGGEFADDSVPAQHDSIAGYGSIGFDQPGETACPENPVPIARSSWGALKTRFR